jgi:hypothetical protein
MYGLTRATPTVLAAAAAGFLLWIATRFSNDQVGGYWARIGLLAAVGFVMALPRLAGGRRKLGSPRLLIAVLLFAFVPVAVASLWVIVAGEPGAGSFHNHVLSWTRDIRVSGLVTDLLSYAPVLAFGTGLVFGFSFETTRSGMRDRQVVDRRETVNRRQRSGFLAFGRRHDEASSAVSADAPAPSDRKRTVETRHREPAVTETSSAGHIDRSSSQNLQPSERASTRERISAYTLARTHDQARAERRSDRDRRSGIDRRQAQVEPFDPSSERRASGERRSGIDRRRRSFQSPM